MGLGALPTRALRPAVGPGPNADTPRPNCMSTRTGPAAAATARWLPRRGSLRASELQTLGTHAARGLRAKVGKAETPLHVSGLLFNDTTGMRVKPRSIIAFSVSGVATTAYAT